MSTGEKNLSFTLKVADNGSLGGNNLFTVRGDTYDDFKKNLTDAFGEDFAALFHVNLKEAGEGVAQAAIKASFPGTADAPAETAAAPAPAAAPAAPADSSGPATSKQMEWIHKKYPGQYAGQSLTKDQAKVLLDKAFGK